MSEEKINFKKKWDEFQNLVEMNLEFWKDEELKNNSAPGPWWILWKGWSYLKKGTYPKVTVEGKIPFDEEFTKKLYQLFKSYSKKIRGGYGDFSDSDSRNIFAATLGNIFMNSIISYTISILDLILLAEPGSTPEWRKGIISRLETSKFGNEMFREKLYDACEWFSSTVSSENVPIPRHVFYYMCDKFIGTDLCKWEKLKPLFTDFKQV